MCLGGSLYRQWNRTKVIVTLLGEAVEPLEWGTKLEAMDHSGQACAFLLSCLCVTSGPCETRPEVGKEPTWPILFGILLRGKVPGYKEAWVPDRIHTSVSGKDPN